MYACWYCAPNKGEKGDKYLQCPTVKNVQYLIHDYYFVRNALRILRKQWNSGVVLGEIEENIRNGVAV